MKKLIVTLVAALFAGATFAQAAPATPATPAQPAAPAAQPAPAAKAETKAETKAEKPAADTTKKSEVGQEEVHHEQVDDDDEGGHEQARRKARVEVSGVRARQVEAGTVLPFFAPGKVPASLSHRPSTNAMRARLRLATLLAFVAFTFFASTPGPLRAQSRAQPTLATVKLTAGIHVITAEARHHQPDAHGRPDAPRTTGSEPRHAVRVRGQGAAVLLDAQHTGAIDDCLHRGRRHDPPARRHGAEKRGQPLLAEAGALRTRDGAGLVRQARHCAGREGLGTARP